ncbi:MAG: tyrosine-type recombinase/integrase [Devosia sp.]
MSVRKRRWPDPITGPNERWVVDYKDGQGKRRHKTFERQKDAKAWASQTAVAIGKGIHVADSASPTVATASDKWIATCEANGLERTTVDSYRGHVKYHLVPMIGETLLSKISVPVVRAFEDQLREAGRSQAMIKRVIGSLGAIIADAQERGDAAHNAVREMRVGRGSKQRQREQRHRADVAPGKDFPTPDEMRAFLKALGGRWRPLLMTAAFCGLRASELRGLRWSATDLTKRELTVIERADRFNEMGPPKSKKGRRTVPIPAMLAQTLREWRLVCPKADTGETDGQGNPVKALDLVFPNGLGKTESHANIVNRGLAPAMRASGVVIRTGKLDKDGKPAFAPKYSGLHALRHFYASWAINPVSAGGMGLTLKEVQERMGHASITMTADRYGHLFPRGDMASEVDAAERALLG